MKRTRRMISTIAALLLAAGTLQAADRSWPQWRGPQGDGVSRTGTWQVGQWPEEGLPERWRVAVGKGEAAPVVVDGRVLAHGVEDGRELVRCFAVADGRTLWEYARPEYPNPRGGYHGPCATMATHDGLAVAYSYAGDLVGLRIADGAKVWEHLAAVVQDGTSRVPVNGFCGSPQVMDGVLVLSSTAQGGCLRGFDPSSGERLWTSPRIALTRAWQTPARMRFGDETWAVVNGHRHLAAFRLADGTEAWRFDTQGGGCAATPVIVGNRIIVAFHHGKASKRPDEIRSMCLEVGPTGPHIVWTTPLLENWYHSAIAADGCLFGIDSRRKRSSGLHAFDIASGEPLWTVTGFDSERGRDGRIGIGEDAPYAYADGKLLILNRGRLVVTAVSRAGCRYLTSCRMDGHWTVPVLLDGLLYVRNRDALVCYDLR